MGAPDPAAELRRVSAERDAVQAELDRLRAIPELRIGQRLRALGQRRPRNPDVPGATTGTDLDSDSAPSSLDGSAAAQPLVVAPQADPADPTGWLTAPATWIGSPLRSVVVQVVLFENEPLQQKRLAEAIRAAVLAAREELGIDTVAVRYGDCSPTPCLNDADLDVLRSALGDAADDVSYVHFAANLGSSGGSNALAQLGDEAVIWVLNPDTYPAPNALVEMLAVLSGDDVGAAEARQLPIEHQKYYDPYTGDTSWVCGFSVLFRRSAYAQVDGFDPHFFPMYCDDVDMSWRLRSKGWSLRYVPAAAVIHDKQIAPGGSVRWTDDAARWSHLARLWLYRRYGRPDLETEFIASIDRNLDPIAGEAIAEFERRIAEGDSPSVIEGGNEVATFTGAEYSPTRFGYAG